MTTSPTTTTKMPQPPISRPPTPRPTSDFHLSSARYSCHSPCSPVSVSPIGDAIRSYSFFAPSPISPLWPDININVISPSVASHRSYYSDRSGSISSSSGFRSPRLALQTSNLLQWRSQHSPHDSFSPNSAGSMHTPISPSISEETENDTQSPPLDLLSRNFFAFSIQDTGDNEAWTPISPSAEEDEWLNEDDVLFDIPIEDMWQHPRLSLVTGDSESSHVKEAMMYRGRHCRTPISPLVSASIQQPVTDSLHADVGLKPHTSHYSASYTPISACTPVRRGWNQMVLDTMTPAERYFIPDFGTSGADLSSEVEIVVSDIEEEEGDVEGDEKRDACQGEECEEEECEGEGIGIGTYDVQNQEDDSLEDGLPTYEILRMMDLELACSVPLPDLLCW